MTKFRKSLLIFAMLIILVGAALGTFVVLSLTGSLKMELITLEFTVGDAVKGYDGKPLKATECTLTRGSLNEGHSAELTFTGEQTDAGIGLSGVDVKIVSEDGYDVSNEYKIKVNRGTLTVVPGTLQIKLLNQDVIYDGKKVDIGDGYTLAGDGLAAGHKVSLKINDEWFERAGNIVAGNTLTPTDLSAVITDAGGADVTGNYSILLAGQVNIVKRPLVLSPVSAEKTYDGKPLECTQYKIETGSLADGHYIGAYKIVDDNGYPAAALEANSENPLKIKILAAVYDINGEDVTENYNLSSGYGYLTVNRANLTVVAKSRSWVYDGLEHSLESDAEPDSVTGLADGETVSVIYSADALTDVGAAESIIDSVLINDGDIENYNVTIKSGRLEVTKAPITVTWKDLATEYGEPFTLDEGELCTIACAVDGVEVVLKKSDYLKKLLEGVTELGSSTYIVAATNFDVVGGGDVLTDNFDVSVVAGNLKIMRREAELKVSGVLEKTYDGTYAFPAGTQISFDKPLASGHSFKSVTCAPTDEFKAGQIIGAKILSFELTDEQGNNAIGYYNITNLSAFTVQIKINAKTLELETKSFEKVYDGTPLSGGSPEYGLLAAGDRLSFKAAEITNCDETAAGNNSPTINIFNSENTDVTDFYAINKTCGTLTVTPKPVTVYIDSEIEYQANINSNFGLYSYIRCDGLSRDYFGLSIDAEYLDCDTPYEVKNFVWREDISPDENLDTDNYRIEEGNRSFTILKLKQTGILITNAGKTYDAEPIEINDLNSSLIAYVDGVMSFDGYYCTSSNLIGKTDAGTYEAEIVYETAIYRLTATGRYTISPMELTVQVGEGYKYSSVYNGHAQKPSANTLKVAFADETAADAPSYFIKDYTLKTDMIFVGNYTLEFRTADLCDADGKSVNASNYVIMSDDIKFSVTKRDLNISIDPVTFNSFSMMDDLTAILNISNLADGDKIVFTADKSSLIDCDGMTTTFEADGKFRIYRGDTDVTVSCYFIPQTVTGSVLSTNG